MNKLIAILILFSLKSTGCSCTPPDSINDSVYAENDFILKGEILSVNTDSFYHKINVRVITDYKSNIIDSIFEVVTSNGGAACGVRFKQGETWLIFASWHKDTDFGLMAEKAETHLCTRSQNLAGTNSIVFDTEILKGDLAFLEKNLNKPVRKKRRWRRKKIKP